MPRQLAEKIIRHALAKVVKTQPSRSNVHVPTAGTEEPLPRRRPVSKADMSPPVDNLEAELIDAAFKPVTPQTRIPISVATAQARSTGQVSDEESAGASTAQPSKPPPPKKPVDKSDDEARLAPAASPRRVSTVAVRHGDHMLIGKRRDNGKYTMPGGHAEAGEDHHQAAHRELEEETGLKVEPKDMHALSDVHKFKDDKGKPLHVQPFEVQLDKKPSTSMKGDPDGEVHRWRWVDVSKGLPEEIAADLHVPADRNVLLKACGLVAPEAGSTEKEGGLDSDDVLGCDLPPFLSAYQALTSGIDYELAAGGLGIDEATETAISNLKQDKDYYWDRWADVNGVDSADLLSKSGAGPNGLSLDLASGQARKPGWIGLDLYPYDHGTIVHDLTMGVPFPDRSAASVRLVNAPDALTDGGDLLLSEIQRVLLPGGQFLYEGPAHLDAPDGFDEDEDSAALEGVGKAQDVTAVQERGVSPVYRQVFTRRANPDPATPNDAFPRLGVAQYDMLPADAALALDALGDFWSDNTTSGRGNRLYGYPSQGSLVEKLCPIAKISPEKQIVYCVVLSPDEIDEDEDYMYAEDIEKAAHDYLLNSRVIGDGHTDQAKAAPVESYICPADCQWEAGPYGPQVVKKGAWVIGIKIFDPQLWQKVKAGEYTSVSVGGAGLRDPIT